MMQARFHQETELRRGGSLGRRGIGVVAVTIAVVAGLSGNGYAVSWEQLKYPGEIKCVVPSGRYVWIGGSEGAWRFDTQTNYILPFEEEVNMRDESIALAGRIVKDIAVDARGRVWFACWHQVKTGGGAGISLFDGVGWHTFTEADGLAGNDVLCLSIDGAGRVWAGTTEGLSVYSEDLWTTYTTADGLMRNDPVELHTDGQGRMWCGFWNGVNVFYRGRWWTWERSDLNYVYGIAEGNEDKMYCSTKGGLAVYDGERWSRMLNKGNLRKRLISSLVSDDAGNIWCAWGGSGIPKGVSVFDGEKWARLTRRSTHGGLASDRIVQIGKDDLERLWFGARDGQVSVMIPDGAPGIGLEEAETFSSRSMRGGQPFSSNRPPLLRLGATIRNEAIRSEKHLLADLDWEEPYTANESGLIAQALAPNAATDTAPATQITIGNPAGLMTSTEQVPFQTDQLILDLQGMVVTVEEIDRVEVNGFQAAVQAAMPMGDKQVRPFTASVMVGGIDEVRFELFKGDQSVFTQIFPITVSREPEKTPPEIHFIHPEVPEEQLIAARSGTADKVSVQLTVRPRGMIRGIATDDTGVKEIRVNGQTALMQDPLPSQLEEYNIPETEGAKYFEQRFDVQAGRNVVTVEAVDLFGNVAPLALEIQVDEVLSDAKFYKSSWAFIVGVDKYDHWIPLTNAVNDARGMRELFETKLNFPADHIFELYNQDATRENILSKFSELSQAGEEDRLVIFFACHGHTQPHRGASEEGFLIPADGAAMPRGLPTLEQMYSWISMEELSRLLRYVQAKHVLLIVDACYSGLLVSTRGATDLATIVRQDQITARIWEWAEQRAVEVITAGRRDERVWDGGYRGHSIFTGFLIWGLESGEADLSLDGVITSEELGTYVWENVAQKTHSKQNPKHCKLPGYEEAEGKVLFTIPQAGTRPKVSVGHMPETKDRRPLRVSWTR